MTEQEWLDSKSINDMFSYLAYDSSRTVTPIGTMREILSKRQLKLFFAACLGLNENEMKGIQSFMLEIAGVTAEVVWKDDAIGHLKGDSKLAVFRTPEAADILRDIVCLPFPGRDIPFWSDHTGCCRSGWRAQLFLPSGKTKLVPCKTCGPTKLSIAIAEEAYRNKAFQHLPILADVLQDDGCPHDLLIDHLRDPNIKHVRGCWAIDLVMGWS